MKIKVGSIWEQHDGGVRLEVFSARDGCKDGARYGDDVCAMVYAINHKREANNSVVPLERDFFLANHTHKKALSACSWIHNYWKIFAFIYSTAIVIATVVQAAALFF